MMNKADKKVVETLIRNIYATWHCCRLSKKEAKAMKLKRRLCDDCEIYIAAHIADLP